MDRILRLGAEGRSSFVQNGGDRGLRHARKPVKLPNIEGLARRMRYLVAGIGSRSLMKIPFTSPVEGWQLVMMLEKTLSSSIEATSHRGSLLWFYTVLGRSREKECQPNRYVL